MSVPSWNTTNTYESPNIVCARTFFTRGAESRADTMGYDTWSSITLGGSPAHAVCTISCTSLMSGSASRGTCWSDHAPATVSRIAAVKTMNGLREHHSMVREIITSLPWHSR